MYAFKKARTSAVAVPVDAIPPWSKDPRSQTPTAPKPKNKHSAKFNGIISLWRGDITSLQVDAIVNAANASLLGGGGVDGAIHDRAGSALYDECEKLNGCSTGDAKITKGYRLPAKHVIHTVGPVGERPADLTSCYIRSLDVMKENNLRTIAFPCISTGVYGYPIDAASHVSLAAIHSWLSAGANADSVDRIILCTFLAESDDSYASLLPIYFPSSNGGDDGGDADKDEASDDRDGKDAVKGESEPGDTATPSSTI